MSQWHLTVVWNLNTSNGKTENTKLKASGGSSTMNMLNVIHISLICSLFSCTVVYNISIQMCFFFIYFLSSVFYPYVLISIFITKIIFRYLLLRSSVSLSFCLILLFLAYSFKRCFSTSSSLSWFDFLVSSVLLFSVTFSLPSRVCVECSSARASWGCASGVIAQLVWN